jgi:hypothetical protein
MIRQGDILLRPIAVPQNPIMGELVERLVLGEATGHAHVIEGSVLAATAGGRAILQILEGRISHPDHDRQPRAVPPGWYELIRQRVYTPVAPRPVGD